MNRGTLENLAGREMAMKINKHNIYNVPSDVMQHAVRTWSLEPRANIKWGGRTRQFFVVSGKKTTHERFYGG